MRPIDADALKEYKCSVCENRERCEDRETVCSDIAEIGEQPTIEAEPVKHGRWIHHAGMNSKCSCCGRYFPVAEFEQRPFDVNFCIHCGARMDGGD